MDERAVNLHSTVHLLLFQAQKTRSPFAFCCPGDIPVISGPPGPGHSVTAHCGVSVWGRGRLPLLIIPGVMFKESYLFSQCPCVTERAVWLPFHPYTFRRMYFSHIYQPKEKERGFLERLKQYTHR